MAITVVAMPVTLTWANFRVVDSSPDLSGNEVAQIHPEVRFPASVQVDNSGGAFRLRSFQLTVAPVAIDTLVLRSAAQTADLLKHEQGHYDLLFLTARALANDLSAATGTSASDLNNKVQTIRQNHATRASTLDSTYDTQTKNGSDAGQQTAWNMAIATTLASPQAAAINGMQL